MKLNVTPGFIFSYLYRSSKFYQRNGCLESFLPVEHDRLLRWIRDKEPIDDFRLNKALEAYGVDRDTYDFLCTL